MSLSPTTVKEPNVKQELDYVRRQKKYDQPTTSKKCYFCGGAYDPNHKCPAKGKSTTVKEPNVKQELDYVRRQKKYDQPTTSKKCYFCGGAYDPNHKCPAKGKSCSKCGKTNHFARVCCSKPVETIDMEGTDGNQEQKIYIDTLIIGAIAEKSS